MDRRYVVTALTYAIAGLMLGIYMAASKDHGQLVTHAHIMLVGFVVSFVYALCHKLWLDTVATPLARVQFYLHQAGTLVLTVSLFLLYGEFMTLERLDPILGIASLTVFVALVLMTILFVRTPPHTP